MRITGFSRPKDKNNHLRMPLNIQVTQSGHGSGRFLSHSLRKRNLSSLDKFEKSQMKSEKHELKTLTPKVLNLSIDCLFPPY